MMTKAEAFARLFFGGGELDGSQFTNEDGEDFEDALKRHAEPHLSTTKPNTHRYYFPDGSAVIVNQNMWDFGFTGDEFRDCFDAYHGDEAPSGEHAKDCPHGGDTLLLPAKISRLREALAIMKSRTRGSKRPSRKTKMSKLPELFKPMPTQEKLDLSEVTDSENLSDLSSLLDTANRGARTKTSMSVVEALSTGFERVSETTLVRNADGTLWEIYDDKVVCVGKASNIVEF